MTNNSILLKISKNKKTVARPCTNCISNNTACCNIGKKPYQEDFEAVISKEEIAVIEKITGQKDFYYLEDDNGEDSSYFALEHNDKGECIFLVDGMCSIYNYRPFDCRMFPFDFDVFKNKTTGLNEAKWFLWDCPYTATIKTEDIEPTLRAFERDYKDQILGYLNINNISSYPPQPWPTKNNKTGYRILRTINI